MQSFVFQKPGETPVEGQHNTYSTDVLDLFPDNDFGTEVFHPASAFPIIFGVLGFAPPDHDWAALWDGGPKNAKHFQACITHCILTRALDSSGLQIAPTFSRLMTSVQIGPRSRKGPFSLPPPVQIAKQGGALVAPGGVIQTALSTLLTTPEGFPYSSQGPVPFGLKVLEITPEGAIRVGNKHDLSLAALFNLAGRSEQKPSDNERVIVERCLEKWKSLIRTCLPQGKISLAILYDHRKAIAIGGLNLQSKITAAEEALFRQAARIGKASPVECHELFIMFKAVRAGPYSDVGKTPIGSYYDTTVAKQLLVLDHLAEKPRFAGKFSILGMGDAHLSHVKLPWQIEAFEIKKVPGQFRNDGTTDEAIESLFNQFVMSDIYSDHSGKRIANEALLARQLEAMPLAFSTKAFSNTLVYDGQQVVQPLCKIIADFQEYFHVEILTGGRTHNTEIFVTFTRRDAPAELADAKAVKDFLKNASTEKPFAKFTARHVEQVLLTCYTRPSLYFSVLRNIAFVNAHTPITLPPENLQRALTKMGFPHGLPAIKSYRIGVKQQDNTTTLVLTAIRTKERPCYEIVGNEPRIIPLAENVADDPDPETVLGWVESG